MSTATTMHQEQSQLRPFGFQAVEDELEWRYDRWLRKTGDPVAASILATSEGNEARQGPRQEMAAMSIKQAAVQLGVSKSKLYELCQDGIMPHTRVGRRITITPAQLAEYRTLSQQRGPSQLRYV